MLANWSFAVADPLITRSRTKAFVFFSVIRGPFPMFSPFNGPIREAASHFPALPSALTPKPAPS